ncbi:hypothetical protein DM860_011619 [Cuscuta australis]|uniref:AIPP2-like SPOC-like domain-containing protein n=2 Tax=Cuscuta sect. Cleistogrammica TaxID=1824901 RepID=A0A328D5G3_9ASTE|nr:hypothetical protein DM860_011619 [Cuscuta australis]
MLLFRKTLSSSEAPKLITKNSQSRKLQQGRVNWEKKVLKGRTKYLSVEEVLKLPEQQTVVSSVKESLHLTPLSHRKRKPTPLSPKKQKPTPMSPKKPIPTPLPRKTVNPRDTLAPNCQPPKKIHKVPKGPNVKKCSNDPLIHPSWKGSFSICDSLNFHGFQAHHSSKACQKVVEFTKLLPDILDFKVVPRGSVWAKLFHDHCPTKDDVGLYVFPTDMESSKEYMTLLELIRGKDVVMIKQLGNVEMLVFASTVLQLDCQKVRGRHFLWALFHPVGKTDSQLEMTEREGAIVEVYDNVEAVDMEIDMMGGQNLGNADVVVPHSHSRDNHHSLLALPNIERKVFPEVLPGSKPKCGGPPASKTTLLPVKIEPCEDVPPGFKPRRVPLPAGMHFVSERGIGIDG